MSAQLPSEDYVADVLTGWVALTRFGARLSLRYARPNRSSSPMTTLT